MDNLNVTQIISFLVQCGAIAGLIISLFYLHNQNRHERVASDNRWAELKTKSDDRWATLKSEADDRWATLKSEGDERWATLKSEGDERWATLKSEGDERWASLKTNTDERFALSDERWASLLNAFTDFKNVTVTQFVALDKAIDKKEDRK